MITDKDVKQAARNLGKMNMWEFLSRHISEIIIIVAIIGIITFASIAVIMINHCK